MRNLVFLRRRAVLVGVSVLLGVLFLGVPGVQATSGQIIVVKRTDPAGDPTVFTFSAGTAGGPANQQFALSDGQQAARSGLPAGTYFVDESVPGGWTPDVGDVQ